MPDSLAWRSNDAARCSTPTIGGSCAVLVLVVAGRVRQIAGRGSRRNRIGWRRGAGSRKPRAVGDRAIRKPNAIATGLEVEGGAKLRNGFVVRSGDFEKVYVVAADIQGLGLEGGDDVGVWATNSPEAEGLIYAVDSVAQEFSDWGDADQTDAGITESSDGVDQARSCAAA